MNPSRSRSPGRRSPWAAVVLGLAAGLIASHPASAIEIRFRSFSGSAAIGPPADEYAAKLERITTAVGPAPVKFTRISPTPAVPADFGGDIVAAVGAGGELAGGPGFDAAYVSGSSLNPVWGFLVNSGFPFGPNFDEFLGFLYGGTDGGGLEWIRRKLDERGRNVVAVPIVGSPHQGSGYFMSPVGDAGGTPGIGLAGLCGREWTFRYLPPAQHVLDRACDALVDAKTIPKKNIRFVTAVAGGQIIRQILDGKLQAFEFATPADDLSTLFREEGNPGTVGARYLHFPGWHQPFLVTYMIVNRKVWDGMLSAGQKTLVMSVARDHVASSYGANMKKQGPALKAILDRNRSEKERIVLVQWPERDLKLLEEATGRYLEDVGKIRPDDPDAVKESKADYAELLEAMRAYRSEQAEYWKVRDVPGAVRFAD